jgi:hypothetical protein
MLRTLRTRLGALHKRLGTAGFVLAIAALVLAMTGAAFAAAGLTAKQKKEVTRIAKKFAGKPGPKGETGATGATGKEGPQGRQGIQGEPGTKGTFSAEPLPSGQSLTGVWSVRNAVSGQETWTSISYPIQVSPAPTPWYVLPGQETAVKIGTLETLVNEAEVDTVCPGSPSNLTAVKGNLCVYAGEEEGTGFYALLSNAKGASPEPKSGVQLPFGTAVGTARGSWVVTAG